MRAIAIAATILAAATMAHADAWEYEDATAAAQLSHAHGVHRMLLHLHTAVYEGAPYRDVRIDTSAYLLIRLAEYTDPWLLAGMKDAIAAVRNLRHDGHSAAVQARQISNFCGYYPPHRIRDLIAARDEWQIAQRVTAILGEHTW